MPIHAAVQDTTRGDLRQARAELIARVARTARYLLAEPVLWFEIDLQHVDVPKDLAKQSLKLKFRMNGITYLKSKASKAVPDGDHCRVDLDIAGAAVFEGGSSLDFELCKAGVWGPSTTLASCQVPLKEALQSLTVGSNQARVWNLTLWATGALNKALGSLAVEVCARTLTLQVAGGLEALRALAVPRPPKVLGSDDADVECRAFGARVAETRQRLQEAMDAALNDASLPECVFKLAQSTEALDAEPSDAAFPEGNVHVAPVQSTEVIPI
uniref:Uncharacterized protein n=1 Tax=Pyrodinium bahamense TaxID=73915 RepID=A0A7S0FZB6_9DINO